MAALLSCCSPLVKETTGPRLLLYFHFVLHSNTNNCLQLYLLIGVMAATCVHISSIKVCRDMDGN